MRNLLHMLIIGIILFYLPMQSISADPPPVWGIPTARGIAISVQLVQPQKKLHIGDAVQLVLRIKNTGNAAVLTGKIESVHPYYLLFDMSGKPLIPKTTTLTTVDDAIEFVNMQPGEERKMMVDMNQEFDFSKAGSYSVLWMRPEEMLQRLAVTSSWMLPNGHIQQMPSLYSNLLTFTLLEKEGK